MFKSILTLYKKYKEIINYLIFGGLTTVVNLLVKYALLFTIFDASNSIQLQISIVISWIAAVLFAYFTNRKYVFESTETNKLKEGAKFAGSRLTTLVLDMVVMWIGVSVLNFSDKIIKLVSQVLIIIGNYIISKLFVFKNK